jgi:hypothetical protein
LSPPGARSCGLLEANKTFCDTAGAKKTRQGDRGVSVWVPRPGLMVGPRFQKDFQRPAMRNSVEGHVSARTVGHQATRPGTARLTGQRVDGEGERPGTAWPSHARRRTRGCGHRCAGTIRFRAPGLGGENVFGTSGTGAGMRSRILRFRVAIMLEGLPWSGRCDDCHFHAGGLRICRPSNIYSPTLRISTRGLLEELTAPSLCLRMSA